MIVAVFGSASPKAGDKLYQLAYDLGHALGKAGYQVMTGGYCGTMEATCKGARQTATAHTIGVTCDEIEAYRPGSANAFVLEEVRTQTLSERIDYMIRRADAYIALQGGVGTLAEIMLTYNMMIIGAIKRKAFILVGETWATLGARFFEELEGHIPAFAKELLLFVDTVDEAVLALENRNIE